MPGDAVPYIERTRALYSSQKPYVWVVNDPAGDPPPWAPITKPLARSRIALFSSGGVHPKHAEPFHFRNDTSHREIPLASPASDLSVAHFGYDFSDAARDPGCVLPIAALQSLAREGFVASIVDPALSFMGGIYSARQVREDVAPRFRDFVLRQKADLAYLVPA
jgi:D-proline reductase (dithiol) PrdB